MQLRILYADFKNNKNSNMTAISFDRDKKKIHFEIRCPR